MRVVLLCVVFTCLVAFGAAAVSGLPWSVTTATAAVKLSFAAYCPQDTIQRWTCTWCQEKNFKIVKLAYNSPLDIFGYVGHTSNTIYISFRGTRDLNNWITDLKFSKATPYKNLPNVTVHDGFLTAYQSIRDQVISGYNLAQQGCPSCNQVIITGHSLGAALSMLCAIDFTDTHVLKHPMTVFNFGCPRVGNPGFVSYFDRMVKSWRVVHNADIVPHLPFAWMGFTHATQEVWERDSVSPPYKMCSTTNGEDPTCSDSLLVPFNIPDHLVYMGLHSGC